MGKLFAILSLLVVGTAAIVLPVHADTNATVESQVDSYFADIPVMVAIANCESGFREFAPSGAVLNGGTGNEMVGVYQINGPVQSAAAMALGFNIDTIAGNLGYARYLYGADGTSPWISSFSCWGPAMTATSSTVASPAPAAPLIPVLSINLSLGMINSQVLTLQQLLNQTGFTLASSGPGSSGNETTKFGAFTLAAVKQFQCAQGIACSGDEYTTGYGFANAATRSALVALASTRAASSTIVTASASTSSSPASVTAAATATVTAADNLAEIAQLKSQIAALETIVAQLEAAIAAKI